MPVRPAAMNNTPLSARNTFFPPREMLSSCVRFGGNRQIRNRNHMLLSTRDIIEKTNDYPIRNK